MREAMEQTQRSFDRFPIETTGRLVWLVAGAALTIFGLRRRSAGGLGLAVAGGALVQRGASGRWPGSGAVRRRFRNPPGRSVSVPYGEGVRAERSIRVKRSPAELYRFWRNFENLPRFMEHVESVRITAPGRSHWVLRGPLGQRVEWDALVHNERVDRWIAWRSLPGSDLDHAGSVHFEPLPGGRTEVRVELEYRPPAGKRGAAVAKLLGEEPDRQSAEDLRRFTRLVESRAMSRGLEASHAGIPQG